MSKNKLTAKQEQSALDYLETGNKTEAYRRNYSTKNMTENTLNCEAVKHFNIPKVSQRVKELIKEREERTKITADMVVKELAKVAFHDIRHLYDENGNLKQVNDLDDDTAQVISSFKINETNLADDVAIITKEYKRHDKMKALEMLGRHMGMFKDKVEHSGEVDIKVTDWLQGKE